VATALADIGSWVGYLYRGRLVAPLSASALAGSMQPRSYPHASLCKTITFSSVLNRGLDTGNGIAVLAAGRHDVAQRGQG
jgi:hypothetical protein